jgi:hypothetical protein
MTGNLPRTQRSIACDCRAERCASMSKAFPPKSVTRSANLSHWGGGRVRQGESEVLVWNGGFRNSNRAQFVRKFTESLQTGGWTYAVGEENAEFTVFNSINTAERRAIIGFWTAKDDFLMLAWTEMLPVNCDECRFAQNSNLPRTTLLFRKETTDRRKCITAEKNALWVNVMGNEMPAMPQFPALTPKPGTSARICQRLDGQTARGRGNRRQKLLISPVIIRARKAQPTPRVITNSSFRKARRISTTPVIKSNGAMELPPFRCIRLTENSTALQPWTARWKISCFCLTALRVEKICRIIRASLLPITAAQFTFIIMRRKPVIPVQFPAASLKVRFSKSLSRPKTQGGRSFVIRQPVGFAGNVTINNIPLGRYKISAKASGKTLKLKENNKFNTPFGLRPSETVGEASILFVPNQAKASMIGPANGAWESVSLSVLMP